MNEDGNSLIPALINAVATEGTGQHVSPFVLAKKYSVGQKDSFGFFYKMLQKTQTFFGQPNRCRKKLVVAKLHLLPTQTPSVCKMSLSQPSKSISSPDPG